MDHGKIIDLTEDEVQETSHQVWGNAASQDLGKVDGNGLRGPHFYDKSLTFGRDYEQYAPKNPKSPKWSLANSSHSERLPRTFRFGSEIAPSDARLNSVAKPPVSLSVGGQENPIDLTTLTREEKGKGRAVATMSPEVMPGLPGKAQDDDLPVNPDQRRSILEESAAKEQHLLSAIYLEPSCTSNNDPWRQLRAPSEALDPSGSLPDIVDRSAESGREFATLEEIGQRIGALLLQIFQDADEQWAFSRVAQLGLSASELQSDESQNRVLQEIIDSVLSKESGSGRYPKRKKDLKRKRSHNPDELYLSPGRVLVYHQVDVVAKLAKDPRFRDVPVRYIENQARLHRFLYPTYRALYDANKTGTIIKNKRSRPAHRNSGDSDRVDQRDELSSSLQELEKEYTAVTDLIIREEQDAARKAAEKVEDAAQDRLEVEMGLVEMCQCCFTESPKRKMISCDSESGHCFCFECMQNYANSRLEQMQWQLSCMDQSGCKAGFKPNDLERSLDAATLSRIYKLSILSLENFESCPFCDYGAICPSVEEDREFRCKDEECGKVSCRLCKETTHIPKTCEEAKRDNGVSQKNLIAEAMTKAVVRICPKCKQQLLKEDGCNKITCRCGTYICDVCGADITKEKYGHFDMPGRPRPCKQSDNVDIQTRNDRLIHAAEESARAKVLEENPDLEEEDLEFIESDAVKNDRAHRKTHNPQIILLQQRAMLQAQQAAMQQAQMHALQRAQQQALQQEMLWRQARTHIEPGYQAFPMPYNGGANSMGHIPPQPRRTQARVPPGQELQPFGDFIDGTRIGHITQHGAGQDLQNADPFGFVPINGRTQSGPIWEANQVAFYGFGNQPHVNNPPTPLELVNDTMASYNPLAYDNQPPQGYVPTQQTQLQDERLALGGFIPVGRGIGQTLHDLAAVEPQMAATDRTDGLWNRNGNRDVDANAANFTPQDGDAGRGPQEFHSWIW